MRPDCIDITLAKDTGKDEPAAKKHSCRSKHEKWHSYMCDLLDHETQEGRRLYLYDNSLLKQPLKLSQMKSLVVVHRDTTSGSIHEGAELGDSLSHALATAVDGEPDTSLFATTLHPQQCRRR